MGIGEMSEAACQCFVNPGWNWNMPNYNPPVPPNYMPMFCSFAPPIALTEEEKEVLGLTKTLWEKYHALGEHAPFDMKEVQYAIHLIQQKVGLRVARRADPDVWNQPNAQSVQQTVPTEQAGEDTNAV